MVLKPPITELHRHLDVSTRIGTLWEFARERGLIGQSESLEAFRDRIVIRTPMSDLAAVLAQFEMFQKVLDRPERLERVAFEALEDCRAEGTTQVEFRFSPGWVSAGGGLDWDTVLDSFERGLQRGLAQYPEMRAGLIAIASRDNGEEEAARTAEFYLKHRSRLIGLDLAGGEVGFPNRNFEAAFAPAKKAGATITIHAGEGDGPGNVWAAIEGLGARRIGHGIRSIEDPMLIDVLRDRGICLEICPTSNWLTQCSPTLEDHPLPKLLRLGVPVTINTDDPGIFGLALPGEFEIARTRMGLSEAELKSCQTTAAEKTFLRA